MGSSTIRSLLTLVPTGLVAAVVVLAACAADPNDAASPGAALAKDYGCVACHTSNGAPGVGPTWKGLYGSQVQLQDGRTLTVDRDYLVRSIKDPNVDVPAGNKVPMPVNAVPDADVQLLVDYIITLK